jgi:GTP cyclohydrolase I
VIPNKEQAQEAIRTVLAYLGEDVKRDGLQDTPKRVVKAWLELTAGYELDPKKILGTTFDVEYDQMVMVKEIPFVSLCEHHVLPFTGTATVAYIPRGRVVGLSKLARLVDAYGRRLQVQERMTKQIADAIQTHLDPAGVGVIIKGNHSCMALRGIQKDATMVTSIVTGAFREEPETRAEFLNLLQGG